MASINCGRCSSIPHGLPRGAQGGPPGGRSTHLAHTCFRISSRYSVKAASVTTVHLLTGSRSSALRGYGGKDTATAIRRGRNAVQMPRRHNSVFRDPEAEMLRGNSAQPPAPRSCRHRSQVGVYPSRPAGVREWPPRVGTTPVWTLLTGERRDHNRETLVPPDDTINR